MCVHSWQNLAIFLPLSIQKSQSITMFMGDIVCCLSGFPSPVLEVVHSSAPPPSYTVEPRYVQTSPTSSISSPFNVTGSLFLLVILITSLYLLHTALSVLLFKPLLPVCLVLDAFPFINTATSSANFPDPVIPSLPSVRSLPRYTACTGPTCPQSHFTAPHFAYIQCLHSRGNFNVQFLLLK